MSPITTAPPPTMTRAEKRRAFALVQCTECHQSFKTLKEDVGSLTFPTDCPICQEKLRKGSAVENFDPTVVVNPQVQAAQIRKLEAQLGALRSDIQSILLHLSMPAAAQALVVDAGSKPGPSLFGE